ncbi:MAG: hypothetical protein NC923_06615, partial [Candidatus Omnitrophica bacterium]|nr:hypothetical protein [Candidatus Omnitrophota bacterium]
IGEIINKLEACVLSNKASILKGIEPTKASVSGQRIKLFFGSRQDIKNPIEASLVVSTIPLDELYYLFCADCNDGPRLKWRGVRLLYIVIKEQIKHPTETFYFPSTDIILGRVSEIKKYSPFINQGIKETLLTIEIPVSSGDRIWEMPEEPLLKLCVSDLVKTGVFEKIPTVVKSFSLKLDKVYPLYILGWESDFFAIYNRLNSIHNLFSVGRGGLFLHCNIDHCITQGLELSDLILSNKSRNKDLWEKKVLRFLKFSARD